MSSFKPRVSVLLPTHERATSLDRAIRSVLDQTFADLELVISDNASQDATAEVCRRAAAADPRVRVLRRPANIGLTANFNAVASEARGEYVMFLADDDWIEPAYVARLVALLHGKPGYVAAAGSARYHAGDAERGTGVDVVCEQDCAAERVCWFFSHVVDNAAIYGLLRRDALAAALPMPNSLAGDWMLLGRMLMMGRLGHTTDAVLHRSVGGTSANFDRTKSSMGLTKSEGRRPHIAMARLIRRDIETNPMYASLVPAKRKSLARSCALAVLRARPLEVVDDILGPLLRRHGLRWLDAALRSTAQRARGGQQPWMP